MDGWQVGLFTLLGVFVGGIFTFWGLKEQLKQQLKLDSQQWKRKVRSEPLLKFRDDLANIATKLHILVTKTQFQTGQLVATEDEQKRALQEWRDYMTSGVFFPTLYIQYDTELIKRFEQIENTFMLLFEYALDFQKLKREELKGFREISQKINDIITEVQEMINKRLEAL